MTTYRQRSRTRQFACLAILCLFLLAQAGCSKPAAQPVAEGAVPSAALDSAMGRSLQALTTLQEKEGNWAGNTLFASAEQPDPVGLHSVYLFLLQRLAPDSPARAQVAGYLKSHMTPAGGFGSPSADAAAALALAGEPDAQKLVDALQQRLQTSPPTELAAHVAAAYYLAGKFQIGGAPQLPGLSLEMDTQRMTPWKVDIGVAMLTFSRLATKQTPAMVGGGPNADQLVLTLADRQLPDGSWSANAYATLVALEALSAAGRSGTDPTVTRGLAYLQSLVQPDGSLIFLRERSCYTALALWTLQEVGQGGSDQAKRGRQWLLDNQWVSGAWDTPGASPRLQDYDCTALAGYSLVSVDQDAVARAVSYVRSGQHDDGGWGTFTWGLGQNEKPDRWVPNKWENVLYKDGSVAEVTAHVLLFLGKAGYREKADPQIASAVQYLRKTQFEDGKWFAYWTLPYIYGTAHTLVGLQAVGTNMKEPWVQKAATWLKEHQQPDGGWGESPEVLASPDKGGLGPSTAVQTAWAVMGLLAAGESPASAAVEKGVRWLLDHQESDGTWENSRVWISIGDTLFAIEGDEVSWELLALARYREARLHPTTDH